MHTRLRAVSRRWFKFSRWRWFFTIMPLAFVGLLWSSVQIEHSFLAIAGQSEAMRAQIMHSFSAMFLWFGCNIVLCMAAAVWAWTAWQRERRIYS